MHDLASELASLRISRGADERRWPRRLSMGLLLMVAVIAGVYLVSRWVTAPAIQTVRPIAAPSLTATTTPVPVLTAAGYLVARRKAVVSAKIQGRLAELNVEEGSRVREGQVIARLDSQDYQAQVAVARAQDERAGANLAERQRQLRQVQSLAQTGVVSQDQLDSMRSQVRVAEASLSESEANLALSQANLQNTFIRAPFAGIVVKKMAEVGESVAPIPPGVNISTSSGAIVAITDMATLEAEVDVSESNVAKLKPEQPAQVSLAAFPDRAYSGRLRQVIPTADRTKATVTVKVAITDPDANLKPEMSARVTFLQRPTAVAPPALGPAGAIRVPKDALVSRREGMIVFAVSANATVRAVPVVTGAASEDEVVIKQGLSGSEMLVANPPAGLKDGERVRVESGRMQ